MNNTKYGRALSGKSYVYSRSLDGFIGLDSASEPSRVSPERMAYSVNMWRDYESENGGAIETVPGWRKLFSGNYRVYGLFGFRGCSGSEYLVVHLGASLYRVPMLAMEKKDFSLANYLVGDGMAEHSSVFFEEGGECFILDGSAYWVLGEEGEVRRVDSLGYVPISYRNGVPYQQRNMLSDRFIECCTVGSDHKSSASHYGWIYEKVTTDSEGQFLRIVGTSLSAIELSHAYIPKSDTVEGGGLRVLEIDDSVLRALVHTEQLVCDAPISFQEYSLCAMTSLRRVVLRNPKSRFAFNACDVLDTVNGAYPTVPLTELWLAAPSVTYDGASHPYSDSSVGISSTADRVTLYTAASEDIWFGSEGVWTPRKTDWVKGVIFSEEKAGTVWQHTGVTRAELFTEYAAELDFSAAENKCTVEFSRYFAYSHVHLRVNDNVYCVSLKDPDTGKSGEERGKWYEYAVCDPFSEILAVKVDGAEERRFTANSESGTLLVMVHPADIGKTLYIYGKGEYNRYAPVSGVSTVYDLGLSDSVSSCDAINHCTVVCAYDGRVFLTGNPQMPNTVFYTGVDTKGVNTPSYVGIFNHFSDGIGNITNVAMVANGSVLAVFKGETSGDGTAYYHEAEDNPDDYTETLLPRIYPALSGASNIPCIGAACNFADDTVFISPGGLEGISKQALNLERTVRHRSTRIDPWLRSRVGAESVLAEWKGYLCLLTAEGQMLLADSRNIRNNENTGEAEYEWFRLDGVGSYKNDYAKYNYAHSGCIEALDSYGNAVLLDFPGEAYVKVGAGWIAGHPELNGMAVSIRACEGNGAAASEVYAFSEFFVGLERYVLPDGDQLLLTYNEGGRCFCPVLSSEERVGGEFSPACALAEFRGRLFFGTACGDVCVFNTDKRGKGYAYGDGIYTEEVGVTEIHNRWYDRCGHRYISGFSTLSDNCGFPQFNKSTLGKTLVVKAKRLRNSSFTLSARSNREEWRDIQHFTVSENSFYQSDFGNFSFEDSPRQILASREKLKKWCEKQLYMFSDGFRRPFGIYGLAYCYSLSGRVK